MDSIFNVMQYKITPELRENMLKYRAELLKEAKNLKHVSGDECEHCGVRGTIRQIEEDLRNGYVEEYEF